MSKDTIDTQKATGMCEHGNFPSTCKRCAEERETTMHKEPLPFQERDPFQDFIEQIDAHGERRQPTQEERERMDRSLSALASLFKDSGVRWQLDGALNISLLKGDYIGIHKDIDVSIESADLPRLDEVLRARGYGLFLSRIEKTEGKGNKMILERVSSEDFLAATGVDRHPMIASVNAKGEVQEGGDLNFIDTHIIQRVDGKPTGHHQVAVPESWYVTTNVVFHGTEIPVANPALVAYYKLHGVRSYDRTDLEVLAKSGALTSAQVEEIAGVFAGENRKHFARAEKTFDGIFARIDSEASEEEIFQVFKSDAVVGKSADESLRALAALVARTTDRNFQVMQNEIVTIFHYEDMLAKQQQRIDELRHWVAKA